MSTLLKPTITTQGLQAIFNLSNDGLDARIVSVGLGEGAYTPDQNRAALESEKNRIAIASSQRASETQIHLSVIDDSNNTFWVREVGFYLEDGTLFAVYSSLDAPLAYKSPEVDLLLAFDLALTGVPAESITVIDQGADLNLLIAPELAKMATAQIDGMRRHIEQKCELINLGDDSSSTSNDQLQSIQNDIALLKQAAANAQTPPGSVIALATTTVPIGWLECNGNVISRSDYPSLFNAIGTTYGAGNGSTTFQLPDLRGEFIRGIDNGRGIDTNRSIGSFQGDAFERHNHTIRQITVANISGGAANVYGPGGVFADFTSTMGSDETRPRNIALMYCIKS